MAHAYTPGLRVTPQATIRKQRRLPLKGEVLVGPGAKVRRDQVVARTQLPGSVTTLNLVNRLGIAPAELPGYMLKKEGEAIQAGESLAATRPFIKWFRTTIEAPVSGTVESISSVTGQVLLRESPRPVEVLAYVDGEVVDRSVGTGDTETVSYYEGYTMYGCGWMGGVCPGDPILRVYLDADDGVRPGNEYILEFVHEDFYYPDYCY